MKTLASTGMAAALAFAFTPAALAAAPHIHGVGTLQLVMEGSQLNIDLRLPAMDVVGFEHAPREAKHKEAVKKAIALLKDSRQLLEPLAAAECVLATAEVESELLEEGHTTGHDHDQHEADHAHSDGETHADFEVAYRFKCHHPEALKQIKVTVFQRLPQLEKLEVESVTPAGQRRQTLTSGQSTIMLP